MISTLTMFTYNGCIVEWIKKSSKLNTDRLYALLCNVFIVLSIKKKKIKIKEFVGLSDYVIRWF